jgi:hypothetical protein
MTESMVTLGCVMAEVFEHESGEITSANAGDVALTFCSTTESSDNKIITTPDMHRLGGMGFLPIAIARIHLDDPSQFVFLAVNGLSDELRLALQNQGCDLVCHALNGLAAGLNAPQT